MNDLIAPEDLVSAMVEAAKIYTNEIRENVEEGIERIADETLKEVKALSPIYKGGKKKLSSGKYLSKGEYRRGWTTSVERSRGKAKITVHNKQYQLVHLLELGHCLKDGTGRVYGDVSAFPHVEIAEKHAEEKINKLLEEL